MIFGIALVCFFLPFATFSCQGQKVLTLSGIQLVTGTTIQQPNGFGQVQQSKVGADPFAVLAFLGGIAGLGFCFVKSRKVAVAPAIAGALGLFCLLLLKSRIDDEVLRQGSGILQVEYAIGFWLTVLLYLFATGLNVLFLLQGKNETKQGP